MWISVKLFVIDLFPLRVSRAPVFLATQLILCRKFAKKWKEEEEMLKKDSLRYSSIVIVLFNPKRRHTNHDELIFPLYG